MRMMSFLRSRKHEIWFTIKHREINICNIPARNLIRLYTYKCSCQCVHAQRSDRVRVCGLHILICRVTVHVFVVDANPRDGRTRAEPHREASFSTSIQSHVIAARPFVEAPMFVKTFDPFRLVSPFLWRTHLRVLTRPEEIRIAWLGIAVAARFFSGMEREIDRFSLGDVRWKPGGPIFIHRRGGKRGREAVIVIKSKTKCSTRRFVRPDYFVMLITSCLCRNGYVTRNDDVSLQREYFRLMSLALSLSRRRRRRLQLLQNRRYFFFQPRSIGICSPHSYESLPSKYVAQAIRSVF